MHRTIVATGHVVLVGKPAATGGPPSDRPPLAGLALEAVAHPRNELELDGILASIEAMARERLREGRQVALGLAGLALSRPRDLLEAGLECAALQAAGRHLLRIGVEPTVRLFVSQPAQPLAAAA